jgi:hypothetical protein
LWYISGVFFSYKYIKAANKIRPYSLLILAGDFSKKLSNFDKKFIFLASIFGPLNIAPWLFILFLYQSNIKSYNMAYLKTLSVKQLRKKKLKKLRIRSII